MPIIYWIYTETCMYMLVLIPFQENSVTINAVELMGMFGTVYNSGMICSS